jgi:cysteine desulfurase
LSAFTYLDHNASALPLAEASRAAAEWLLGAGGNPSSVHRRGRAAKAAVSNARRAVAEALGVKVSTLTFASGATEALHLAIGGLLAPNDAVLVSAVEHPAVAGACRAARAHVSVFAVDSAGRIDPAAVAAACTSATRLVVVMAAQNELGNTYDVAAVAAAVAPIPVVVDAVQAWGKVPIDLAAWTRAGVRAVAFSGHKIGAPTGVGVLYAAPGAGLRAVIDGGPQEGGRRAGTENVAGIVGLGVAASQVDARLLAMPAVAHRRDRLEAHLMGAFGPRLVRHGDVDRRLPNTSSFRIEGVPADLLVQALDLADIAISAGSACASGALEPSSVLRAIGLSPQQARCGVRVSLGPETTDEDVMRLVSTLPQVVARAQAAGEVRPCA